MMPRIGLALCLCLCMVVPVLLLSGHIKAQEIEAVEHRKAMQKQEAKEKAIEAARDRETKKLAAMKRVRAEKREGQIKEVMEQFRGIEQWMEAVGQGRISPMHSGMAELKCPFSTDDRKKSRAMLHTAGFSNVEIDEAFKADPLPQRPMPVTTDQLRAIPVTRECIVRMMTAGFSSEEIRAWFYESRDQMIRQIPE